MMQNSFNNFYLTRPTRPTCLTRPTCFTRPTRPTCPTSPTRPTSPNNHRRMSEELALLSRLYNRLPSNKKGSKSLIDSVRMICPLAPIK